ncbi:LysE family transporter [Thermoanaerobacterium sp. DL9XJH110]|uniref:LysE family transporter n=1 Tax=Thermoanaerobacterium sp. DL9XJH110 TaxID=3386643 RepID=UPI003BB68BBC
MNIYAIFLTAFLVGLSGAMMPGPLVTVAINESLKKGLSANLFVSSGHAFMEALVVLALIAGLGDTLDTPSVAGITAVVGSIILFKMAHDMIKEAWLKKISLDMAGAPDKSKSLGPGFAGIFATVSNPYWLLWWATIGSNYTALSLKKGVPGVLSFYIGHVLSDFTWLLLVGLMMVTGKKFINDTVYRGLILVMGVFLGIMSIYFFCSGIRFLK